MWINYVNNVNKWGRRWGGAEDKNRLPRELQEITHTYPHRQKAEMLKKVDVSMLKFLLTYTQD